MTTLPPAYIKRWLDYAKSLKTTEDEQESKFVLTSVSSPDEIYLEQYEYIDLIMQKNANQKINDFHKPVKGKDLYKDDVWWAEEDDENLYCDACMHNSSYEYDTEYPCNTIRIIKGLPIKTLEDEQE